MRAFYAPRSGVDILSDQFLFAHYRCDEASGTDLIDDGPDGHDLAQAGAPAVYDKVYDQAAGAGVGGRDMDGSTDTFIMAGTLSAAQITSLQGETTLYGWVQLDSAAGLAMLVSVGGSGGSGAGNNYITQALISSGVIAQRWQHSTNTLVSHSSSYTMVADTPYFVCITRTDDPDNAGRYVSRIRIWAYANAYTSTPSLVADDTSNNLVGTDSTTTAKVNVGCYYTGTSKLNGKITDIGIAKCRLAPEWDRKQFANGVRNYRQDELTASKAFAYKARALLKHDGEWKDLTNLEGHNFVKSLKWSTHVDNGVGYSGAMVLKREFYYGSLARDMQTSIHNLNSVGTYTAAIDAKVHVKFETALYPQQGRAPYDWEYDLRFEGFIRKPDWAKFNVDIDIDGKAQLLRDVRLDTVRNYSDDGSPENLEDILQEQIDDNEPSTVGYLGGRKPTVVVLGTVSKSPGIFNLPKGPLLDAQQNLVRQIGWKVGYIWHDDRQEFLYTLWEPDKSLTSVRTLGKEEVLNYNGMTIDGADLVTRCRVYYGDETTQDSIGEDERAYEEYIDTTARARYGDLYGEINEGSYNLVEDSTEALDLATLVVTELGSPTLWASPSLLGQSWPEIGDLVTLEADERRFSADTDIAIIGINDEFQYDDQGITARTDLTMRGDAAVCGFRSWQMEGPIARPGGPPSFPAHTLPEVTGLSVVDFGNIQLAEWDWPAGRLNRGFDISEVHIGTPSSYTPSDSTLIGVTRGNSYPLVQPSLIGSERFVKVVPRSFYRFPGEPTANGNAVAFTPSYTPALPRFKAYDASSSPTLSGWTLYAADTEEYDVGSNYDTSVPEFEAPVAGLYLFHAHLIWGTHTGVRSAGVYLEDGGTNDEIGNRVLTSNPANGYLYLDVHWEIELTAGQIVTCWVSESSNRAFNSGTNADGEPQSFWAGRLVADG